MRHNLLMIHAALAVLGCGGGEESASPSAAAAQLEASVMVASDVASTLAPVRPNARSQESSGNGGVVAAWVSGADAYVQRHTRKELADGLAARLPVPHEPVGAEDVPHIPVPPAVLVQATGDVAVVYARVRPATLAEPSHPDPSQQHMGVYLQRYSASGALLQAESEVTSMLRFAPGARLQLAGLRMLALSDGGFVVSWGVGYGGGVGATQLDLFMRRFDRAGAAVGGTTVPVQNHWCANRHLNSTFEWEADEAGGFSVTGTLYPKEFDGEDPCGGYGPPVQKNVRTVYPPASEADPGTQPMRAGRQS
jgi:hypothetical protein